MTSKQEKLKRRILASLNPAELSTDKGPLQQSQFTKPNKKIRRHSGRYTPQLIDKQKFSEMIANAEEPTEEYDNWTNYRDSFRDVTSVDNPNLFWDEEDRKIARKRNKKILKQLAIRKAMKNKKLLLLSG